MPRTDEALVVVMIRNGGWRRAFKAAAYLVSWGIVREHYGHDVTWPEYESYWKQSRATTAREVKAFKACFGADAKVADVWAAIARSVPAAKDENRPVALEELLSARWAG